jgi:hypothetical protein
MKRKDIHEGEWYLNPMMESHGVSKLRFTKTFTVDKNLFPSCNVILYSEGVSPDGEHHKFSNEMMVRQSNGQYETFMKKVEEREVMLFVNSKKYGL